MAPLVKGSALLKVKLGNRASPPTLRSEGVVGAAVAPGLEGRVDQLAARVPERLAQHGEHLGGLEMKEHEPLARLKSQVALDEVVRASARQLGVSHP